jgi:hypothetical protein
MLRSSLRHRPHYYTLQLFKKEIDLITTTTIMGESSSTGSAGASGRNNKTGRSVGGGTNKEGNRGGPYVPPARRYGTNHQDGKWTAAKEGASKSNAFPHKGQGQWGGTSKPRNSNTKTFNNTTRQKGRQRLRVYSTDDDDTNSSSNNNINNNSFWQMHNDCKALRYKVHKPRCDCPKLLRLVESHDSSDELTAVMLEDGRIDALVVVPDTKQKYVYVCRDTPVGVFEDDPRAAETKLRDELFPKTVAPEAAGDVDEIATARIDETKFKLSCAHCLLQAHEPNGFCLIASSSASVVDTICDSSRSNKDEKEAMGRPLHPDHSHFVANLPRSSLWNLYQSKTRAQKSSAVDEILGHLSNQDINAAHDPERFTDGIELGHHLLSVLALTSRSNDSWLVMGYDDHKSLELDLPGGKRHLGETSLEGAIRETEEETSLVWDASWVTTALQSKKRSEGGNRYFVLHPPQSLLDHQTDDH